MSKITFRADDDLVRQLEAFDASKSEVMREALRAYLDGTSLGANAANAANSANAPNAAGSPEDETIDDLIAERVDAIIAERLERTFAGHRQQDINVNIALDRESDAVTESSSVERKTSTPDRDDASDADRKTCKQCGEALASSAVYCSNCGEKASRRVFCDCGDEVRTDWAYCPSCGRRTPAADVLDNS